MANETEVDVQLLQQTIDDLYTQLNQWIATNSGAFEAQFSTLGDLSSFDTLSGAPVGDTQTLLTRLGLGALSSAAGGNIQAFRDALQLGVAATGNASAVRQALSLGFSATASVPEIAEAMGLTPAATATYSQIAEGLGLGPVATMTLEEARLAFGGATDSDGNVDPNALGPFASATAGQASTLLGLQFPATATLAQLAEALGLNDSSGGGGGTQQPTDPSELDDGDHLVTYDTDLRALGYRNEAEARQALSLGDIVNYSTLRQNMLDNANFQVNSRDFAGGNLSGGERAYDRWHVPGGATATVSRSEALTSFSGRLQQSVEIDPQGGSYRAFAVSASVASGKLTARIVYPGAPSASLTLPAVFTVPANVALAGGDSVYLEIQSTGCDIRWVKVENGPSVTPYAPTPYARDCVNCQRYFRRIGRDDAVSVVGLGVAVNADQLWVTIPLGSAMARPPVCTITDPSLAAVGNGTVTSVLNNDGTSDAVAVMMLALQGAEVPVGGMAALNLNPNCYIELDADV